MIPQTVSSRENAQLTYYNLHRPDLEPVPAKSPHRKYLVLLAMHMVYSDDPQVLSDAADCSERTFHYVKRRLDEHDGVTFEHDRSSKRYMMTGTGVLDINKVAELMRQHYPKRFAYIEKLSRKTRLIQCGEPVEAAIA